MGNFYGLQSAGVGGRNEISFLPDTVKYYCQDVLKGDGLRVMLECIASSTLISNAIAAPVLY